jgi:Protein of unknown function (DUF3828)
VKLEIEMKMQPRHRSLIPIVLLSISLASVSFANGTGNLNDLAPFARQSPENVVKDFYKWYITSVEAGTDPFKKGRTTLQKYVTLRLIRQIARAESDGSDADAFLQTQEWDKSWANTAAVSKLKITGATATAIVTFDATANYPRALLTLVKQGEFWKIDRVKNAPF